ncbi:MULTISPECIES: hypothetical protein [Arthrobacter]|uniref:Uncharacterized protein n=1 Tax=Arthrobacter terricola TaxID=2547396 RepID=A0A4R5JYJ5_9MICC|nr:MULTISPECIES: hypothetical protein [Arthrobacter]MBT8163855.1 hypothetical protein [Arthrobacter sp. GN70]TDF82844.1 hypothetical protein E1809_26310 [Arthrobacter terricola]
MTDKAEDPGTEVQVRFDSRAQPLAIRHGDSIWMIDPGSATNLSEERSEPPGNSKAVPEGWRVQARNSTTSELRTMDLLPDPGSDSWHLTITGDG